MADSNVIQELLATYREAAIHAAEFATSSSEQSNRWADAGIVAYKMLSVTPEGRSGIMALQSDENPYVRGLAAAHSLQWAPQEARAVLEALRDNDGAGAFEAKWTLIEYDNGTLSFD